MGEMFKKNGTLKIPLVEEIHIPREKVDETEGGLVLREAYCPEGHSLICDKQISGHNAIHFIYKEREGRRQAEIAISAVVGERQKIYLSGGQFEKGEMVNVFCPTCKVELPILFDCECGAPIYFFYIDKRLDSYYGQSFCSRIGCVQASRLRFSRDMLREFIQKYCL